MNYHKIIYGNNIEIMKKMEEESINLVVTSPPYPGNDKWGPLYNESNVKEAHRYLSLVWNECIRLLKPGCKLIINIGNLKRRPYLPNTYCIYSSLVDKIEPLGEFIWDKGYPWGGITAWGSYRLPSDPSTREQHEYILVFRKFGKRDRPKIYKKIDKSDFLSWINSIWKIAPGKASKIHHIAPFPIEIPRRLITLYSFENEIILDPFLGSASTQIASEQLERNSIGIEISKDYCELAYNRMKKEVDQLKLNREQKSKIEKINF